MFWNVDAKYKTLQIPRCIRAGTISCKHLVSDKCSILYDETVFECSHLKTFKCTRALYKLVGPIMSVIQVI